MKAKPIKILIVEDHTMLRESLEYLINGQDDMKVIGTTEDASRSPELCRKLKPDLVLMDVVTKHSPDGISADGLHYTAEIRKSFPDIKTVVMTGLPEITFHEEAKKAGAHSFLEKEQGNEHLLNIIRKTMKGYNIYTGNNNDILFRFSFTEKEMLLIHMVSKGMNQAAIAKKMKVSTSKVQRHMRSILDKTGSENMGSFRERLMNYG